MREPAEFGRYYIAILYFHILAFAERLYAVHTGVFYVNLIGIPERRAAKLGHLTALKMNAIVVPEGISEIEIAVLGDNASALLERTLAVRLSVEFAVFQMNAVAPVERPLGVKNFVRNGCHRCIFFRFRFLCEFLYILSQTNRNVNRCKTNQALIRSIE